MPSRPSAAVISAFEVAGIPVAMDGGQGSSWRVGDAVLKPLDVDEEELAWQADLHDRIVCDGFRLAAPLRATNGSFVVDGWTAARVVSGRHETRRWADIIAVGDRLHAALVGVDRPAFIDRRMNPWAVADRVAWGEMQAGAYTDTKHLSRLRAALRSVHAPSQIVHSDLTGNVLFDEHLPPAIIDFSPYWRPAGYAAAIVVGDALTWEGADASLLDAVAHIEDFGQYLLRAVIFRAVTDRIIRGDGQQHAPDNADPFMLPVELACRLAARGN